MSYKVEVPAGVETYVNDLKLSDSIKERFYKELQARLSVEEVDWYNEAKAPIRFKSLKFSIFDLNSEERHNFFVWVNIWERKGTRLVLQVEHKLAPPSV